MWAEKYPGSLIKFPVSDQNNNEILITLSYENIPLFRQNDV